MEAMILLEAKLTVRNAVADSHGVTRAIKNAFLEEREESLIASLLELDSDAGTSAYENIQQELMRYADLHA